MPDSFPASPDPGSFSLVALLRHGLITLVFCCLVALGLTVSTQQPWDQQLVYSLAIGTTTWLVIDIGRHLLRTDPHIPWPSGLRGPLLVAGGILCGFGVGTLVGDLYCGCSTWGFDSTAPKRLWASIAVTVSAGVAGSYYFFSRGKSKFLQAGMALAQRDAAEARLKLLETQLEPHMLFNTLANLRVLIGSDPERAIAMLDRLNNYLRATLSGSLASSHSLQAEFARLRDYLELMAVRMGPRLSYTLDLPPELAGQPVPPLLLQPLVENSIKHGLEPQVEGGNITVNARREGQLLVLEVVDSGVGLPPQAESGQGFGLVQVRERLQTAYGPQAAIDLLAIHAGGTRASITFPYQS
ncbi:sensor histidine kinase [Polaromonas sp. SM01]|uniref:sensor histidine kinase n=1 Tax=Polaromonas sp. SM01 TaxID=3085630 RepID=UPI0029816B25|nr:histidine kinase [Polaromonas sp. SM01]MDW5443369.1 histidine kinase [Polaromonas sp. SM01]